MRSYGLKDTYMSIYIAYKGLHDLISNIYIMSIQVLVPLLLLLSIVFGGSVSYSERIASKTAKLSNQLYEVSK